MSICIQIQDQHYQKWLFIIYDSKIWYQPHKSLVLDGWMGGWMDGWMDGYFEADLIRRVESLVKVCCQQSKIVWHWMDGWVGGWVDGW